MQPTQSPSSDTIRDLVRLVVVSAHRGLLARIVDCLMQGTQLLALTGPPGVGKTIMAEAIHEELSNRSVRVRRFDRGGGDSIRLRTIISQLLDKPESDVDGDDIERLFDALTERDSSSDKLAVIIDDADRLHSDAFAYLRLLSSVAIEHMPQIVFVGDRSFWAIADQPAQAGFRELITARFELEPLSPRATRAVAGRLMSALSHAGRPVFDPGALEAIVQRSDGLVGRLVSLVAIIEAIATEQHLSKVTAVTVDAAAARLDHEIAATRDAVAPQRLGGGAVADAVPMIAYAAPELKASAAIPIGRASIPAIYRPRRARGIARMAAAIAMVVGIIGAAMYSREYPDVARLPEASQTAFLHVEPAEQISPAATLIVRLPPSAPAPPVQTEAWDFKFENAVPAETTVVASEIIEPPVRTAPQIGAAAAGKRSAEAGKAPRGRAPGFNPGPPDKGTWLFPTNSHGGG